SLLSESSSRLFFKSAMSWVFFIARFIGGFGILRVIVGGGGTEHTCLGESGSSLIAWPTAWLVVRNEMRMISQPMIVMAHALQKFLIVVSISSFQFYDCSWLSFRFSRLFDNESV